MAPEHLSRLKAEMTDAAVVHLGADRALTSVLIEATPMYGWAIGGTSAPVLAHVVAQVKTGSTDADQRACYIGARYELFRSIFGRDLTPVSYVIVDEVPPDAWGVAGRTHADRAPPFFNAA